MGPIRQHVIVPGGLMSQSEIARFRQQQLEEETSARLGLNGPAAQASHEIINARMQQGARVALQLFKEGRREEAYALLRGGILRTGEVPTETGNPQDKQ